MENTQTKCTECGRIINDGEQRFYCLECDNHCLCSSCKNVATKQGSLTHELFADLHTTEVHKDKVGTSKTVADLLSTSFVEFAQRPCLGERIRPDGDFAWMTFAQIRERVDHFVAGAIQCVKGCARGNFACICGRNKTDWFIADWGFASCGVPTAAIHHIIGDKSTATAILNKTRATVVVCQREFTKTFAELRKSTCPTLLSIVQMEPFDEEQKQEKDQLEDVYTLEELISYGAQHPLTLEMMNELKPGPKDLYTVVFTSGSTGVPKGVPFSHELYTRDVVRHMGSKGLVVDISADSLAHISDRQMVLIAMCSGGRTGLCASPENVFEDIRAVRPTFLSYTPRFWGIVHQEFTKTWLQQKQHYFDEHKDEVSPHELNAIYNRCLQGVRDSLGGRVNKVTVGGAFCSAHIKAFLKEVWGDDRALEGYGLTETSSVCDDKGRIYPDVEWSIIDCPELGYTTNDIPFPRGELLVRTECMANHYFSGSSDDSAKEPTEENKSYEMNGFFHTGDIVELIGLSQVRLIDRRKAVFKLAQGEFVSPQKVEECLASSVLLKSVFVTTASAEEYDQCSVLAVAVPDTSVLRERVKNMTKCHSDHEHIDQMSDEELCRSDIAVIVVMNDMRTTAATGNLRSFEIPGAVLLDPHPWSQEEGTVTASGKMCRPALKLKYKDAIDKLARETKKPGTVWKGGAETTNMERVSDALKQVFGYEVPIQDDVAQSFISAGGDSLQAVRLASILKETCRMTVSPGSLLTSSESKASEDSEEHKESKQESEDKTKVLFERFKQDANLSVVAPKFPSTLGVRKEVVLLTGATGFLGCHLLRAILSEDKDCLVVCPIRKHPDESKEEAENGERLMRTLSHFGISLSDEERERVAITVCDISEPYFGLDATTYVMLATKITRVIHAAAQVNHVKEYDSLRRDNVLGTFNVLQLAVEAHCKHFCFVSTSGVLYEGAPYALSQLCIAGGYEQTKRVCELMCAKNCKEHNITLTIVRPGLLSWNSETGAYNDKDWLSHWIRGCAQLGCAPENPKCYLHIVPVDFAAEFIACVYTNKITENRALALINTQHVLPMHELLSTLASLATNSATQTTLINGMKALNQPISFAVWREYLHFTLDHMQSDKRRVDIESLLLFDENPPSDGPLQQKAFTYNLTYPEVGEDYISKFFQYLAKQEESQ